MYGYEEKPWKVGHWIWFNYESKGSKQWYYCKLRRCGYENLLCPFSTKVCKECRFHRMGLRWDEVSKVYR